MINGGGLACMFWYSRVSYTLSASLFQDGLVRSIPACWPGESPCVLEGRVSCAVLMSSVSRDGVNLSTREKRKNNVL